MARIHFTNLGCKLNQAEVERLARRFVAAGHTLAASLDGADLHVVNSCTVTREAARDSRKAGRRARRRGLAARTVLTGCHAAIAPDAAVLGVDLVVPNADKDALVERVHAAFPDLAVAAPAPPAPSPALRARALVKVEDGCSMRCAFCVIPRTRGPQRSRPLAEVVAEVRARATEGVPEVVVTGVQISEYRDGVYRLHDLVAALLAETPVPRLRLTSIAPWRFDDRLVALFADRRLCRHLHLSLQSGATATLRRMRRPYTAERYAALVERLRERIPGVAVTTDVIVGFPGEDDAEHAASIGAVRRLGFARTHVFPFSPRPGTEAASMAGAVPRETTRARAAEMLAAAREGEEAFARRHLGATLEVAWERPRGGRVSGLTDNAIRVFAPASTTARVTGTLRPARLERVTAGGVDGTLVAA